ELLGGGKTVMVGNLIRDQFLRAQDWPSGSVLAMVVVVALLGLLLVQAAVARRIEGPRRGCHGEPGRRRPAPPSPQGRARRAVRPPGALLRLPLPPDRGPRRHVLQRRRLGVLLGRLQLPVVRRARRRRAAPGRRADLAARR